MIQTVSQETGVTGRNLYFPLNVAFTGDHSAPQIDEVLRLFANSTIIELLTKAIAHV